MTKVNTVGSICDALWTAYPRSLAEDWDTGIGLTCGDPNDTVSTVLLSVDVDDTVVTQAIEVGAQLLVTHHPLLFSAVQSVSADTPKGRLIHRLGKAGVAHFAAHTNADRAVGGVNDALAATLGLIDTRPIDPVPEQDGRGLGRIGQLPQPITLREFADLVRTALPRTAAGIQVSGDPDRLIRTVAVCGGAGGSLLPLVTDSDVYVTADLSHHVAAEYVAEPGRPALVRVTHWASEWPWLAEAALVVDRGTQGSVQTVVADTSTDAWTFTA